ncbi:MAG: hypothetical protein AAFQ05_00410 [Pseudomonadota bacterium]
MGQFLKITAIATKFARRFRNREDGAVTVDWVVLTAAAVGLAAGAGSTIQSAVTTLGDTVAEAVSTKTVSNGD